MEEPSEAEMRDMSDRCEPQADEPHVLVSDPDQLLSVDPGFWPARPTDNGRASIVRKIAVREDEEMPNDGEGKPFPDYLKYSKAPNGREKVKRDWLVHSKCLNALFCIPHVLFSHSLKRPSRSSLKSIQGYKMSNVKWRRMYDKFPSHENNRAHRECYLKWKDLQ